MTPPIQAHPAPDPSWRIPDTLNSVLALLVTLAAWILLWFGSQPTQPVYIIGVLAVVYSYLMLTNYSLMHEAAHNKLHSHRHVNHVLGVVCGFLFPMSHTLLRNTHNKHHLQNRSDAELFDLYYPTDSIFKKRLQWYSILSGIFWFYPVLGSIALAVFSPDFVRKLFPYDRAGRAYTANFTQQELWYMRLELVLFICYFYFVFHLLNLNLTTLGIFYACAAFSWSTRQFIEHAFTQRHLIEGSLNLRHFRLMSLLLLHRELDLNHHRYPTVPWLFLPRLLTHGESRVHYLVQYLNLWRGPLPGEARWPQTGVLMRD